MKDLPHNHFTIGVVEGCPACEQVTASVNHGPTLTSWFGQGMWPECSCGFAPHDNAVLNAHWAEHGFEVYHDTRTGQLVKRPL